MKAKNQPPITSEADAKEKLIAYVYEYLTHSGAKNAAQLFKEEIGYVKDIQINPEAPGFLVNWWCVFWDLYCAAPEKRNLSEPSSEARAFHEYNSGMRTVMSPSCAQTSPPQQQGGPPTFIGGPGGGMMGGPGGPRYHGPHSGQLRGATVKMGQRMQPGPQMGGPPPHQISGPPPGPHPPMMGGVGSPRYAPHPGHMTPGSSASSGPLGPEPGPSPGLNRMTPNHSSSPHPPPPGTMAGPGSGGMPPGGPPPGPSHPQMQQRGGPPPPQNWQGQFNVNSPADQQCFMSGPPVPVGGQQNDEGFGGMLLNDGGMMDVKPGQNQDGPPNQQQDEYIMPNTYGQQNDQGEAGPEIMKIKQSLESNTKEYNDTDQAGFGMDFLESQNKW